MRPLRGFSTVGVADADVRPGVVKAGLLATGIGPIALSFVEFRMQNFPVKRGSENCYKDDHDTIVGEPEIIEKSSPLGPLELHFQVSIGHVVYDHAV